MNVPTGVRPVFELNRVLSLDHSGKLSLPVKRNALLYARYKHVRGVPSIDPSQGFGLGQLRVLDNLIDRLIAIRDKRPIVKDVEGMNQEEIKALIAHYRKALHDDLKQASDNILYLNPAYADMGVTLDIVA